MPNYATLLASHNDPMEIRTPYKLLAGKSMWGSGHDFVAKPLIHASPNRFGSGARSQKGNKPIGTRYILRGSARELRAAILPSLLFSACHPRAESVPLSSKVCDRTDLKLCNPGADRNRQNGGCDPGL